MKNAVEQNKVYRKSGLVLPKENEKNQRKCLIAKEQIKLI